MAGELVHIVADHDLQPHIDTDFVETLGQEQRIAVDPERGQHLAPDCDDAGSHLVIWSIGHLVIWPGGHLVISSVHLISWGSSAHGSAASMTRTINDEMNKRPDDQMQSLSARFA